ncbi:MAG: hypothetical protein ABSH20_26995 [Tepidisphaeraceae bacterium]|jgi:hypothetical protein
MDVLDYYPRTKSHLMGRWPRRIVVCVILLIVCGLLVLMPRHWAAVRTLTTPLDRPVEVFAFNSYNNWVDRSEVAVIFEDTERLLTLRFGRSPVKVLVEDVESYPSLRDRWTVGGATIELFASQGNDSVGVHLEVHSGPGRQAHVTKPPPPGGPLEILETSFEDGVSICRLLLTGFLLVFGAIAFSLAWWHLHPRQGEGVRW